MEKKNIDWENLDFGYRQTDKRFVANYKDGAWDEGTLTEDANIVLNECAGVLQYAQTVFEGLKAYTTVDGKVVIFRPDLNASRMADSARRLEMPVYPEDKFIEAVEKTVKANFAYVPPYGTGATLYIRPYMFGSSPVIGVKPAQEYQFRVLTTPVGPYFKGGVKPLTIRVTDFDRAAPHGTGHIKAGLNYAMSLHAIVTAHEEGYAENMYLDAQHIGADWHTFDIAAAAFGEPEAPAAYYVPVDEALDRRAEYLLSEKNVEAQKYRKRMERGKRLPTVAVGAGYLYYNVTDKDVDDGMVFAQVSIPISDWWGGAHALKKARIDEMQAENDRLEAREMLAVEIERTWSEVQEAHAQILLMQRSVASATENLRQNRNFYDAGTATLTDLLDAETLYTQSRNNLTSAYAAYHTSLAKYMRVTGR